MHNSFFSYDTKIIKGKKLFILGIDGEAVRFAVRLSLEGIAFDGFLSDELDEWMPPNIFGKKVYTVEEYDKLCDTALVLSFYDERISRLKSKAEQFSSYISEFERIDSSLLEKGAFFLYGTGYYGKQFYDSFNDHIKLSAACDSRPERKGDRFNSLEIMHYSDLDNDSKVIIAANDWREIKENCLDVGVEEKNIYRFSPYEGDRIIVEEQDVSFSISSMDLQLSLIDLIYECNEKHKIVYGNSFILDKIIPVFNSLGIDFDTVIRRNSVDEDGSIFELVKYDLSDASLVILDNRSEYALRALDGIPIRKEQIIWVKDYNPFYEANHKLHYDVYVDPILSFDFKGKNDLITGFADYSNITNEKPVVIVTLGGSTTTEYMSKVDSWSKKLSDRLTESGISHRIYCGGMPSYMISQDFLKLARDGIWINPDIVIEYSGVNDMSGISSAGNSRFISFFSELMSQVEVTGINADFINQGKPKGYSYGFEGGKDGFEHWYTYLSIMKAICDQRSIKFLGCLQPCMFSRTSYSQEENDRGFLIGTLYKKKEKGYRCFKDHGVYHAHLPDNEKIFLDGIRDIKEDWFVDMTSIFDTNNNCVNDSFYIDWCHLNDRGNSIVAEYIYDEIKKREWI